MLSVKLDTQPLTLVVTARNLIQSVVCVDIFFFHCCTSREVSSFFLLLHCATALTSLKFEVLKWVSLIILIIVLFDDKQENKHKNSEKRLKCPKIDLVFWESRDFVEVGREFFHFFIGGVFD